MEIYDLQSQNFKVTLYHIIMKGANYSMVYLNGIKNETAYNR